MVGLCFYGTIDLTQYGVQALQGVLFLIASENTFSPMYAVLAVFPQAFPLFMREKRSGLYDTVQYYLAHVVAMVKLLFVLNNINIIHLLYSVTGIYCRAIRVLCGGLLAGRPKTDVICILDDVTCGGTSY